jgi:hypothetical protein
VERAVDTSKTVRANPPSGSEHEHAGAVGTRAEVVDILAGAILQIAVERGRADRRTSKEI